MMDTRTRKRSRKEMEDEAESGKSSWQMYQKAHPKQKMPRFATPKPQKETNHVLKVPNVLEVQFLKNPSCSEFYKLSLTFKPSFPLNKIRCPDEISGDPPMCIHGLFNLTVSKCGSVYLEGDMKFNTKPFNSEAPIQPLKCKDLYEKWWSCLGTVAFANTEQFLAYEEHKHNFGSRYPRDVFLLNGLVLGMNHIKKFLEILEQNHYVVGQSYNCKNFIKDINKGFQVDVEVNFVKLDHKRGLFGLRDIGLLLNDEDWKLRNFCPKRKNKIDNTSEFFLEDFATSVEERQIYKPSSASH